MQSGSKLVLGIFGLALMAAALSWWYRYESAHRSTSFWGPHFAELIARPSDVTAFGLRKETDGETSNDSFPILAKTYSRSEPKDLTKAPGMVHLRHSILTDGNYNWDKPVQDLSPEGDDWRWCLQFTDGGVTATLLFNEDFTILGRLNRRADEVRSVDCRPLAETLAEYFAKIEAFPGEIADAAKPQAAASKDAE